MSECNSMDCGHYSCFDRKELSAEITTLEDKIRWWESKFDDLQKDFIKQTKEIEQLEKVLEDDDAELVRDYYAPIYAKSLKIHRIELTAKDHTVKTLEDKIRVLEEKANAEALWLSDKDERIHMLEAEVNNIERRRTIEQGAWKEIESLQNELYAKTEALGILRKTVKEVWAKVHTKRYWGSCVISNIKMKLQKKCEKAVAKSDSILTFPPSYHYEALESLPAKIEGIGELQIYRDADAGGWLIGYDKDCVKVAASGRTIDEAVRKLREWYGSVLDKGKA